MAEFLIEYADCDCSIMGIEELLLKVKLCHLSLLSAVTFSLSLYKDILPTCLCFQLEGQGEI